VVAAEYVCVLEAAAQAVVAGLRVTGIVQEYGVVLRVVVGDAPRPPSIRLSLSVDSRTTFDCLTGFLVGQRGFLPDGGECSATARNQRRNAGAHGCGFEVTCYPHTHLAKLGSVTCRVTCPARMSCSGTCTPRRCSHGRR